MNPIGLQYSDDDGSTWSTALTIKAMKIRITEVNEASNETIAVTGKKYPRKFTYLRVDISTELDAFDPALEASLGDANTNWAALEDVCKGLIIRLYNNETTCYPNLDGHTEFNSSSNTNYLLLESNDPVFLDMDEAGATGRKRRYMKMELITQSAIA